MTEFRPLLRRIEEDDEEHQQHQHFDGDADQCDLFGEESGETESEEDEKENGAEVDEGLNVVEVMPDDDLLHEDLRAVAKAEGIGDLNGLARGGEREGGSADRRLPQPEKSGEGDASLIDDQVVPIPLQRSSSLTSSDIRDGVRSHHMV
jgi:hypothetical protein